jgi:drug/metabolite transporter (DMT)-like permease
MLIGLSLCWGLTWPVNRLVLYEISPFSMRVATCSLGALLLFAVAGLQRRDLRIPRGKARIHVAIAGTLNIAGFALLTALGQIGTTTSRVIILGYSMPIWACMLAVPILGERIDRTRAIALALCVAGIVVMVAPLAGSAGLGGLIFSFAAGVSWAAGTVYLKWARISADPVATTCWQIVAALVVACVTVAIFEGGLHLWPISWRTLVLLVSTGLVGSGLCYLLWFAAVRRLPASTVSLGILSVPVIGIVASALVLGERPTITDYIGCALILAAAACVLLAPVARQTTPIEPTI